MSHAIEAAEAWYRKTREALEEARRAERLIAEQHRQAIEELGRAWLATAEGGPHDG